MVFTRLLRIARIYSVVAVLGSGFAQDGLTLLAAERQPPVLDGVVTEVSKRKGKLAESRSAMRQARIASVLEQFSWKLFASASAGRLNTEALTELQIAWRNPATSKLLDGDDSVLALRSSWMINESSRALSDDAELRQLAEVTRKKSAKAAQVALGELAQGPQELATLKRVVFACLAARGDSNSAEYLQQAVPLLLQANKEHVVATQLRLAAVTLLSPEWRKTATGLTASVAAEIVGDDLIILTAMACHRHGGDAWQAFRSRQHTLLGRQPLRGETIVIVNRLNGGRLVVANASN